MIADRGLVQKIENGFISLFDTVPGVDQNKDPGEIRPAAQIVVNELRPRPHLLVANRSIAIAGHVDEAKALCNIEEDELLRAETDAVAVGEEKRFSHHAPVDARAVPTAEVVEGRDARGHDDARVLP